MSVPPKYPAIGIPIWNSAKRIGMANLREGGMSGSQRELDSVTAIASIARATPRATLSMKTVVSSI